ncbi:hypothetical protein E2C01_025169 [Portunus trituberculatus]|uniref:Uncharacterized protein n=1 Tax=Portunus trituberculatus TaxID=210409 RepID=A0A5B7EF91_PORTR|nr:hypothetical protein [Portunus trituberculatus]
MSGSPYKWKSEVIWSDHAYSVANKGGLSPFCQTEIGLKTENKRLCLGLVMAAATTKESSHVEASQRTMPVEDGTVVESSPRHLSAPASDRKQERQRLSFPAGHGKTASELFSWFAALLKQHPDLQPLYKEGRNQPYITVSTDSSFYATLVSEGFLGLVMECPGEEGTHPVIIHGVTTYINVNLIEVPAGFHELKRRMVGQMARPQLLGVMTGKVSSEVHLLGLGRRRVERYTPEPDLYRHCSRWRHKEWRCQSAPRCRYCAGPHKSAQCLDKIKEGTKIPPRCCDCGGDHNALSTLCTVRSRPQREPAKDEASRSRLVFRQAPPPQTNQRLGDEALLLGLCPSPVPAFMPHQWHFDYICRVPAFATAHCYSALCASKNSAPARHHSGTACHRLHPAVNGGVSGLSNEFAAFKNQQHTVCSGTSTVAPTTSPASGAQRGQGESDVCQHSLCDPSKKKDNAAEQCATAAAPSPRMTIFN